VIGARLIALSSPRNCEKNPEPYTPSILNIAGMGGRTGHRCHPIAQGQRVQVFGQAVQDPNAPPPAISSAAYNGTTLKIKGSNFGPAPRVLLNGSDVTRDVKSESVSVIKVKGDMAALGVVSGMNTVQVVNVFNVGSNTVAFSVP